METEEILTATKDTAPGEITVTKGTIMVGAATITITTTMGKGTTITTTSTTTMSSTQRMGSAKLHKRVPMFPRRAKSRNGNTTSMTS